MVTGLWKKRSARSLLRGAGCTALLALMLINGCASHPQLLPVEQRTPIDRKVVEYPSGYVLKTLVRGVTAGSAIAFVNDDGPYKGSLLVAETGVENDSPRIYGWKSDGSFFNVYPRQQRIPLAQLVQQGEIYPPIGGIIAAQGQIFVTHRDNHGRGVVSSVGFDGSVRTVIADLPAQGDYSVTDIAIHPITGRLYFGMGSATNSGVVGIDNWDWVTRYPDFCDSPSPINEIKLLGYKFFTRNPNAGLFGGDDNVGTAPFHPFGKNSQLRIRKANNEKPTSAIYTISPSGGDPHVWAFGIRLPRGLAFDTVGNLFATDDGMELRGTRPVKDDPDSLLKIVRDTWYGWPDFSADLSPISEQRFQEPDLISRSGYPELSALIDHSSSSLANPAQYRDKLLYSVFPSQSGAAKLDFVPLSGPFKDMRGSVILAMSGDRAPLSTSGRPISSIPGRKVVRVDMENRRFEEFIHNTEGVPASKLGRNVDALERPVDVKFGPDGKLYILDYGEMRIREGREHVSEGTGKIFVLEPIDAPPAQ